MKSIEMLRLNSKLAIRQIGVDGCAGDINLDRYLSTTDRLPLKASFIASWGEGWDHVSVSYPDRCPTWDEMCKAKDIFFREDECVVQFHPPKSEHINCHPWCLHLWRWQNGDILLPPKEMV